MQRAEKPKLELFFPMGLTKVSQLSHTHTTLALSLTNTAFGQLRFAALPLEHQRKRYRQVVDL